MTGKSEERIPDKRRRREEHRGRVVHLATPAGRASSGFVDAITGTEKPQRVKDVDHGVAAGVSRGARLFLGRGRRGGGGMFGRRGWGRLGSGTRDVGLSNNDIAALEIDVEVKGKPSVSAFFGTFEDFASIVKISEGGDVL